MKLGTQTNSLVNNIMSREVIGQPAPFVGMGATVLSWTDRHAATVVKWDQYILIVQEDNAKRIDSNGMSESQTYEYTPDPKGALHTFLRMGNGLWQEMRLNERTGRLNKRKGGHGLKIGVRDTYHDFSF